MSDPLEKLGFEKYQDDAFEIVYFCSSWNASIIFNKKERGFYGYTSPHAHGAAPLYIGGDLLKAVLKMMKEWGWYDEDIT